MRSVVSSSVERVLVVMYEKKTTGDGGPKGSKSPCGRSILRPHRSRAGAFFSKMRMRTQKIGGECGLLVDFLVDF